MRAVLLFMVAALSAALPASGANPDPLVGEATAKKVFVLAEFVSKTCPACEEMRPIVEEVLARHRRVSHQIHDADVEVELAKKYQVKCVPVFVVVNPKGDVRFNDVGMRTAEELEQILRDAGVGPR